MPPRPSRFGILSAQLCPEPLAAMDPVTEYWACRTKAVVLDASPQPRKYEITGPDAELLVNLCVTQDARRLDAGQAVYTAMCQEKGDLIDEGTMFRLGDTNFRWVTSSEAGGKWLRQQAADRKLHAWVRDGTDQLHLFQVQGPLSREILKDVVWTAPARASIDELSWSRFSIARIKAGNGTPIVVSRTGSSGELGYEVFCHPKDLKEVKDVILEAGAPKGLIPAGPEAMEMLRIEAGRALAGKEFHLGAGQSSAADPFEAGIGFTVPLDTKMDDFIGRDALVQRKEKQNRALVGLELLGEERGAVNQGNPVFVGGNQVGEITSGMRSPVLGKSIGLCRIAADYVKLGTKVEVAAAEKRLPGVVVQFPHYDPDQTKVRIS